MPEPTVRPRLDLPMRHDINARVPVMDDNGDTAMIYIGLSDEDAEKIRNMGPDNSRILGDLFLTLRDSLRLMHRSETGE